MKIERIKVIAFMPARNEEETLTYVLESMLNQSVPFSKIILVNDASTDNTKAIAEGFGIVVISLTKKHPSYVGKPELARVYNHTLDYIDTNRLPYDYLMQNGGDTVLPLNYVEEMLKRMEADKKLVISGGQIEGEAQYKSHVRGSGRFYKAKFWNRYIRRFPEVYMWESYPLYKAKALGYEVKHFPELKMKTLRPTASFKLQYGRAMKELGYFPPYALARCFLSILLGKKKGVGMLLSYCSSESTAIDSSIEHWIKHHQIDRIIHFKDSLRIWRSRI